MSEHSKTLRALIVGFGSMGRRHLASLGKLGVTDVLRLRSGQAAADSPSATHVRDFTELEAALAERPNFAVISTPTSLHVPVALACARAGCDLFIEKPVSADLAGLDELAAEVKRQKLVTFVGYDLRFHPVVVAARDALLAGEIGRTLAARLWVGQYLPDWYPGRDYRMMYVALRDLGGGMLLTLSHEVDYAFWLLGGVRSVISVLAQPSSLEMNTDSLAELVMVMKSGAVCNIHMDCLRRTADRGFDIVGERGSLRGDLIRRTLHLELICNSTRECRELPLPDVADPYVHEMAHVLDCLRSREPTRAPLSEGIEVMQILAAAQRSAATGTIQPCF